MAIKHQAVRKNFHRKQFDGKDPALVIQKLEQAWAIDATDAEAALFADISPAALCVYLKKHPRVSERKMALLNTPGLKAKISLVNSLPSDPDRALKYLERTQSKRYAPLQRQATTDSEGNNLSPRFEGDEAKI